jgi:hypothetical protein
MLIGTPWLMLGPHPPLSLLTLQLDCGPAARLPPSQKLQPSQRQSLKHPTKPHRPRSP